MCSQWRPSFVEDTSQLPCVVYLHGNSSARVDVVKTRSLTVRFMYVVLHSENLMLSRGTGSRESKPALVIGFELWDTLL